MNVGVAHCACPSRGRREPNRRLVQGTQLHRGVENMTFRVSGLRLSCVIAVVTACLLVGGLATPPRLQAGSILPDQWPTVTVRLEDGAGAAQWTYAPTGQHFRPAGDSSAEYVL